MSEYVKKHITLKKEHAEWVEKNCINLSRFVQRQIDEEIEKERRRVSGKGD